MNNFKNIAKNLAAITGTSRLISKKSNYLIKPITLCTGLFCLLSVTIFSCTKDNNFPATGSLMVVQGASNIPHDNIFLNIDNTSVSGRPLNYGSHTDYLNAIAGSHTVKMYENGPGALTIVGLAADSIVLNARNSYSLFFSPFYTATTDNYPGKTEDLRPGFTLLIDSLSKPAGGQAKIRFVNVSPNAGFVDLVRDGTVLVPKKSNGGYSLFISVDPSASSNFEVRENGSSVVFGTLKNIEIKSGGIYTIWLYGLTSDVQGTGLNLGIITNKQY